jgi:TonB family protein
MQILSSVRPCCIILCLILASASGLQSGDMTKDAEKQLRNLYENQPFILRNFYQGSRLKYDPEGTLVSGGAPGIWTTNGFITINKLKLKEKKIELTGKRKFWSYDRKENKPLYFESSDKIKIEIGPFDSPPDAASLNKACRQIFLQDYEPLQDAVPDYWKNSVRRIVNSDEKFIYPVPQKLPRGEEVATEPVTLKKILPTYTELARQARLQGIVVFNVVVSKEGHAIIKDIIRPLGLGLDESAIEAISQWKFMPAYNKKNEPIDLETYIEVTFEVY